MRAMQQSILIERTAEHVRGVLKGDSSGHDWPHIDRVRRNALHIGREEHADLRIVELAALLHDITDWKFHGGDDTAGPAAARAWLESQDVDDGTIDHVCGIIAALSFKGANVASTMPTLEGQVVQDADRLDAIGAIGIARAFAYGGHAGRALHDPDVSPTLHHSFEAYKSSKGPTLNHFYEKLLLLKDRMNTRTGRRLAAGRHTYMKQFLHQFLAEWNGEA
jgi:uncharacterized protein